MACGHLHRFAGIPPNPAGMAVIAFREPQAVEDHVNRPALSLARARRPASRANVPSWGATTLAWDMAYQNLSPSGWTSNQSLSVTLRNPANDAVLAMLFQSASGVTPASAPLASYGGDVSSFAGQSVRIDVQANTQTFYLDLTLDDFRIECD